MRSWDIYKLIYFPNDYKNQTIFCFINTLTSGIHSSLWTNRFLRLNASAIWLDQKIMKIMSDYSKRMHEWEGLGKCLNVEQVQNYESVWNSCKNLKS